MNWIRNLTCLVCLSSFLATGCGGAPSESADANIKRQQEAKLEAMKQLAEAVGKGDRLAISGAIEGLNSNSIDVKANPEAAKEILDIYNKQVKGKLKGEDAMLVKGAVDAIENQLKK